MEKTSAILSRHLKERLAHSEVRFDPSPYVFVENVFPDPFYEKVRANLPQKRELYTGWGIGRSAGKTHYQRRKQIYIHNRGSFEEILAQTDSDSGFWLDFHAWFMSKELQSIMLSPFERELKKRFGGLDSPDTGEIVTNGMINFHEAGYFIGPHPDTADRVATAIFYLPEDNAPEGLGTRFYRPKDASYNSGKHGDFADFDVVWSAPYRRNSALLFLRTQNSYHGVEPITEDQVAQSERFVIQYMLVHRK